MALKFPAKINLLLTNFEVILNNVIFIKKNYITISFFSTSSL